MNLRSMLPLFAAPLMGCAGAGTTDGAGERAAADRGTDCMQTPQITEWHPLDERNLIVYEGTRPYHVELNRACAGLDFARMIAFYDRGADRRICGNAKDRVVVDRLIPEACGITAVDELTDEQAADLARRAEQEHEKALARPRARN